MKKGGTGMQINKFTTIIVREDLEPGYKVVQSSHALADFAVKYENEFKEWQCTSNYLCCLETSKLRIEYLISKLDELKIKYSVFLEPDIGNELTAITIEAVSDKLHKQLFKKFKLTLS